MALVEDVIEEASAKNHFCKGVLLLVDELGKLLEYAAVNPGSSDVFILQQLAELAARSNGKLAVVAALHQDFRAYANHLPPVDRAEWEKIRGRYEDIVFEEPPDQLLRFLSLAWGQLQQTEGVSVGPQEVDATKSLAPELWQHRLAPPGLSPEEGVNLLSSCAPLHPLASVLLGSLFRRVGQNERSSFTFLASNEPNGLRHVIDSKKPDETRLFDVVDLYCYLVSAFGNALLNTMDARRWAEALEAEARCPELSADAVTALRAAVLLGIASRWSNVKATRDVIEYGLRMRLSADRVEAAIHELLSASVLVHRRYNDSFAVWEGSDVDVETCLSEGRDRVRSAGSTASLLRNNFAVRPVLARRHSYESGTLRFFSVDFVTAEELRQGDLPKHDHCDGRLLLVASEEGNWHGDRPHGIQHLNGHDIIRLLDRDAGLGSYAMELGAIEWVKEHVAELKGDSTARRELHARLVAVQQAIDELVADALGHGRKAHGRWFHNGEERIISGPRSLNELLSSICDDSYLHAPKIDNEIINRRELSSAAAAARRNLIEQMIESPHIPELGLEGNPPERSIYRSLLSSSGGLGVHRKVKEEWGFRTPAPRSSGAVLFKEIQAFFESAVAKQRRVEELFEVMHRPPFGLREGPVPILLCAALLASESEVALYEEGSFCPKLTPAIFDRLMKAPEQFSLRKWKLSGVRARLFEELERLVLGDGGAPRPQKQRLLRVARPLLRFISSLPAYTMSTADLSPRVLALRDVFAEATEPDVLFFQSLPLACGLKVFGPKARGKERSSDVAEYVRVLAAAVGELRAAYPRLLSSVQHSLADGFGVAAADLCQMRSSLQAEAAVVVEYAIERDLKFLLGRILETDRTDEAWLEGVASFLAEKPVDKWRDEDRAHFNIRLRQFVRRFGLLRATVTDRPVDLPSDVAESVRVSLTGTAFGQVDHAIHLGYEAQGRAGEMAERIEAVLDGSAEETETIGALCRVLQGRLAGVTEAE